MQAPTETKFGSRVFIGLALTIFLFHTVVLAMGPRLHAELIYSNLAQVASAILATAACIYASRGTRDFVRHFWWFAAASFAIWSLAQLIAAYYDSILHYPTDQPWPSDILFFLAVVPMLMTLFIDQEKGFLWKQRPRLFDLFQLIILAVAAYLFVFNYSTSWKAGWAPASFYYWVPDTLRDSALILVFLASAWRSQQKTIRSLYRFVAIFLFVYLVAEFPYLYLQALRGLKSGTFWDFSWSVPYLFAAVMAAMLAAQQQSSLPLQTQQPRRASDSSRWSLVHLASLLFPLPVLVMAAGLAEKQLLVVSLLVLFSFACAFAKILFAEQQQNEAAKALQESNALLRSVFEGTGDALFVKDAQGRYLIVNQAFGTLANLAPAAIIGKRAGEFLSADDALRVEQQDRLALDTGQRHTFQSKTVTAGRPSEHLITKAPWRDADGKIVGLLGVLRDVTEYRHMEERLRQSQKMEAIGTLAGGVAHDFNNLLMIINGYSSVLSDSLSADTKLRGHADQIFKAGERAASLTRQLLAFSRKQTIQAAKLNLNQIIAGMEKLLHRLIGENIKITATLAPDLGSVLADAGQMEQVILNLAVNARDAMPSGGRLIFETRNVEINDATIPANNLKPGRYIEFMVSDTGVGMELDVQTRLFEPFFTTKAVGKGTGLGLATVYGILKQAGGYINFTSQPGKGTTFRVYLPRTDALESSNALSAGRAASLNGSETVLLVEDDPTVCELVRAVLTEHGYRVILPERPSLAEKSFDQHNGKIDLVLSDVIMPDIGGAELARRLTAKNPHLRVLFMSGYIGDDIIRHGIQQHEVPFLQKPFTPNLLLRKVREVLDAARVTQP